MSDNATVYVTQQPIPNNKNWVPNLSPALQYGKLAYVFDGGQQIFSNPNVEIVRAKSRLEDFDPDRDFLLWPNSGDPAALWVCQHALAGMGLPYISYLYWERGLEDGQRSTKAGFYSPVRIEF